MNSYVKEFDAAVEEAASNWGLIIMTQQERLGDDLFKIEDYPTVGQFRGKFSMRYYVDQLPEKGDWLLDVPEDSITELAGSFDNQMEQRINELKCCVLDECAETMAHALQLLRKGGGSVRGALVANVRKTMGWLRDLNIDEDHRILDIVKKIEDAVVNPGATELRENELACARATAVVQRSLLNIRRLSEEAAS